MTIRHEPCPFCGGKVRFLDYSPLKFEVTWRCMECYAEGKETTHLSEKEYLAKYYPEEVGDSDDE